MGLKGPADAGEQPGSLSDLPINNTSTSENFLWLAKTFLARLLNQRSALRKPDASFDLPPPRGG
jgi:hypothetical protein